jgi:hypothetical protein
MPNFVCTAQNRAGGRALTADQNLCIEEGAQWIHGEHNNTLYQLAHENNLLSDLEFAEGLGKLLCYTRRWGRTLFS